MPLRVESVSEDDLLALTEIEYKAFCIASPLNALLYPNGMTEPILAKGLPMRQKDLADPSVVLKKVIDTSKDSEIIAHAKWKIFRTDQPLEEWDINSATNEAEALAEEFSDHPDFNSKLFIPFARGMDELKRRCIKGKARIHLANLTTHPDHQRRGAAKMLLDYGAELAEREGLQTTILASYFAVPLYTREGFEGPEGALDVLDLKEWGVDARHVTQYMVKPAPVMKGGV